MMCAYCKSDGAERVDGIALCPSCQCRFTPATPYNCGGYGCGHQPCICDQPPPREEYADHGPTDPWRTSGPRP